MPFRTRFVALLVTACFGCGASSGDRPPGEARSEPEGAAPSAIQFKPHSSGRIEGRVTWRGPIPTATPFLFGVPKAGGSFDTELVPNPHQPAIDPETLGVADVVVYLRGIEPEQARPWDHASVTVEVHQREIRVRQGDGPPRRVGFVKKDAEASLISLEPAFQIVRGRGAAFFSFTFPEKGRPLSRRLEKIGAVELSSGTGYYWARAHLFVDEHPYYTLSDREGRFRLDQVPPGSYKLVSWLPNWEVERRRHDPESGLVAGLDYGSPLVIEQSVRVEAGKVSWADFVMTSPAEAPE